jgi:hypothetical protein
MFQVTARALHAVGSALIQRAALYETRRQRKIKTDDNTMRKSKRRAKKKGFQFVK